MLDQSPGDREDDEATKHDFDELPLQRSDIGIRKRKSDAQEDTSHKRVTFEKPVITRRPNLRTNLRLILNPPRMLHQEPPPHQGKPIVFDMSQGESVEAYHKEHKLGDVVVTVISEYDEKVLQDFLNFEQIKSFTFLFPGGYLFLPSSHLIICRQERTILIGRYQDSSRYFHWQPQILFEVDEFGIWSPTSAMGARDEVIGGDIMVSSRALNRRREGGEDHDFDQVAGEIAQELSEALLNCSLKKVTPIVESTPVLSKQLASVKD